MPAETKTIEKKQRLLSLLREMFQLDQPDLDFGLYRIMHAKRGQLEAFLETEFDQLIDKVFADRGARHEDDARREYEAARQQAAEFGAPDPDAAPKIKRVEIADRDWMETAWVLRYEATEVFEDLLHTFDRDEEAEVEAFNAVLGAVAQPTPARDSASEDEESAL